MEGEISNVVARTLALRIPSRSSTMWSHVMPDAIDRDEDAINQDTITSIAQEMHYPLPVVRRVYETEFARLKADARVKDYLVLFAARRTRDALLSGRV
ncbi:MAG: DUF3562 domain-containing protein [Betaproteobacteria bacterium]|nr:MAG: DUF3562 domain-containing protein [Betaproteobacteria bacterium]